jgi:hypothetical protein
VLKGQDSFSVQLAEYFGLIEIVLELRDLVPEVDVVFGKLVGRRNWRRLPDR